MAKLRHIAAGRGLGNGCQEGGAVEREHAVPIVRLIGKTQTMNRKDAHFQLQRFCMTYHMMFSSPEVHLSRMGNFDRISPDHSLYCAEGKRHKARRCADTTHAGTVHCTRA